MINVCKAKFGMRSIVVLDTELDELFAMGEVLLSLPLPPPPEHPVNNETTIKLHVIILIILFIEIILSPF